MDGVEAGRVVVSAASDRSKQAEIIVVFIQHFGNDESFTELAAGVRRLFGQQAGLEVAAIIPIDEIPRTTSGKVRRYVLRQAYERGDFDARFDTIDSQHLESNETGDASSDTEHALLDICAGALGNIKLQRQDNFFELGMSSLKAIEIHELIDQCYPGQLEVSDIFEHPTLAELAGFLDKKTRLHNSDRQAAAENSQL